MNTLTQLDLEPTSPWHDLMLIPLHLEVLSLDILVCGYPRIPAYGEDRFRSSSMPCLSSQKDAEAASSGLSSLPSMISQFRIWDR